MDESGQSKKHEPSPLKLRKARERGEVPAPTDMGAVGVLLALLGALAVSGDDLAALVLGFAASAFRLAGDMGSDVHGAGSLGLAMLSVVGPPLLVVLGLAMLAGVAVRVVQIGPVFSFKAVNPTLERLDPASGLKQRFASPDAYEELAISVVKTALGLGVAAVVVRAMLSDVVSASALTSMGLAQAGAAMMGKLTLYLLLGLAGIAVLDWIDKRRRHRTKLRMSDEEVKREYKDQEGDPEIKRAMKDAARAEPTSAEMTQNALDADVGIINPTHIIVLLRYDPSREKGPRVVAKGRGDFALQLRAVASRAGVPIRRDERLARLLVGVRTQALVPVALYRAVGAVLRWAGEEMARSSEEAGPRPKRVPHWARAAGSGPGSGGAGPNAR